MTKIWVGFVLQIQKQEFHTRAVHIEVKQALERGAVVCITKERVQKNYALH